MLSRLTTGAQVAVYINNALFGRVADIEWSTSTPRREIHTVDWLGAWEHVQGPQSIHGTMAIYRLHGDGGIESVGMQAAWRDATREKYFSMLILDRVTDIHILRCDKCSVNSQSWRVGRGYVMGTIGFTALEWS